jgi:GMP synthase (glutamine-hydrolysing)
MAKNALVLQHDPTIHLGNLEPVLVARGYDIQVLDARTADFANLDVQPDLVVVLGNDSGVYEKDLLPYIAAEEAWLAARLAAQQPTLGVCFGAQIMASALGERVYKGDSTQIGFRSVEPTEAGATSPVRHFAGVPVMEWHGDTFDLPAGATRLAGSSDYANEAFALGSWGLAVQFHPETTTAMHERWLADGRESVVRLGIDPDALAAERDAHTAAMGVASQAMLNEFLDGLAVNEGR